MFGARSPGVGRRGLRRKPSILGSFVFAWREGFRGRAALVLLAFTPRDVLPRAGEAGDGRGGALPQPTRRSPALARFPPPPCAAAAPRPVRADAGLAHPRVTLRARPPPPAGKVDQLSFEMGSQAFPRSLVNPWTRCAQDAP